VLKNDLLEAQARALLLGQLVGEELLKEDAAATAKLREELAEATSSLNTARDEIALLKAENETYKEEVVGLKKVVDVHAVLV